MTLAQQLIAENKATKNPFLDLGNCGLTELPDELFDCVWLENLNLGIFYYDGEEWRRSGYREGSNQLKTLDNKGSLLSKLNIFTPKKNIGCLKNLRVLFFTDNQIIDISCLQGLSNLTHLGFWNNQVTDISCLKELNNLTHLYFMDNQVADISCLQVLNNLIHLVLAHNKVVDISSLKALTNLTYLDFSSNQVLDISSLVTLTELKTLRFNYNQVTNILSLAELKELCSLEFSFNKVLDISPLDKLTKLQIPAYIQENPAFFALSEEEQKRYAGVWAAKEEIEKRS
jgi:Leucine-rich repeat (LRR) protein